MAYDEPGDAFTAWQRGRTGFPVVDAGMRQLRATGWMHNRVRMIVASFLVKDLHVEWQHGARHFLRWLVDGDLASNNHGWQWVAGSGTDAAPYFRVFNPLTQGRKFDPDGSYVRRWVPELARRPRPARDRRPQRLPGPDRGPRRGAPRGAGPLGADPVTADLLVPARFCGPPIVRQRRLDGGCAGGVTLASARARADDRGHPARAAPAGHPDGRHRRRRPHRRRGRGRDGRPPRASWTGPSPRWRRSTPTPRGPRRMPTSAAPARRSRAASCAGWTGPRATGCGSSAGPVDGEPRPGGRRPGRRTRRRVPLAWAALDCPGGWAGGLGDRLMVLGRMSVAARRPPRARRAARGGRRGARPGGPQDLDRHLAVRRAPAGWSALAEQVWIEVDAATFGAVAAAVFDAAPPLWGGWRHGRF